MHGITYSVTCMECTNNNEKEKICIEETSPNVYKTGKEHLTSLVRKEESSVLRRHNKDKCNGHILQFCMSVTGQFPNMMPYYGKFQRQ